MLEGRQGGRWYERDVDGTECDWGSVLVREPPSRVVLAWRLSADWAYDPDVHTELEVRFVSEGPIALASSWSTAVWTSTARGRTECGAASTRPAGWPGILADYAQAV